jgi:hypothetical protein
VGNGEEKETMETTEIKKPKLSRWKPAPYVDQAGSYAVLSVINYDRQEGACPSCGSRHVLFNAMDCRGRSVGGQIIVRQCKACLEKYAAERSIAVSIKTTCFGLERVWGKDRLPEAPLSSEKGLAALRARREAKVVR